MAMHVLTLVAIGDMGQKMSRIERKIFVNLHQAAKVGEAGKIGKDEKVKVGVLCG
jgi:hypothetical protein